MRCRKGNRKSPFTLPTPNISESDLMRIYVIYEDIILVRATRRTPDCFTKRLFLGRLSLSEVAGVPGCPTYYSYSYSHSQLL